MYLTDQEQGGPFFFEDDHPNKNFTIIYDILSICELKDYLNAPEYQSFREKTLLIVDEVHNIGKPDNISAF